MQAGRLGLALSVAFFAPWASAQTAAGKPPAATAKPAADNKTLGGVASPGVSANSKLLTRDELRACMKQRDVLSTRLSQLDSERVTLDAERVSLRDDQEKMRVEREDLGGTKTSAAVLNERVKVFQGMVDGFNKRVASFKEANTTGKEADRVREEINREGEALQKRQAELQVDREALLAKGEEAVKAFNVRAAAVDQRVADWNVRNSKLNEASAALKVEREAWVTECSDRRFREDDEKAILKEK